MKNLSEIVGEGLKSFGSFGRRSLRYGFPLAVGVVGALYSGEKVNAADVVVPPTPGSNAWVTTAQNVLDNGDTVVLEQGVYAYGIEDQQPPYRTIELRVDGCGVRGTGVDNTFIRRFDSTKGGIFKVKANNVFVTDFTMMISYRGIIAEDDIDGDTYDNVVVSNIKSENMDDAHFVWRYSEKNPNTVPSVNISYFWVNGGAQVFLWEDPAGNENPNVRRRPDPAM